jgi:hypothetical protein
MFRHDQPDYVRDECLCLMELGARVPGVPGLCLRSSPVVSRIIQERFLLARVPQLINEAVVGLAVMRLHQNPQDNE